MSGGNGHACERGKQRGFALLLVLWTLAILSVFALSVLTYSRSGLRLAQNMDEAVKVETVLNRSVQRVIAGLLNARRAKRWRVDGTVYAWADGDYQIRVSILQEDAKIDLNAAEHLLLAALFRAAEIDGRDPERMAANIIDYRDADEEPEPLGAEASAYKIAGLSHGPKNAPFERVAELREVLGITREAYRILRPALTVYTGRPRPNAQLAGPLAERALSIAGLKDEEDTQRKDPDFEDIAAVSGGQTPRASMDDIVIVREGPTRAQSRVPVYTVRTEALDPSGRIVALEFLVRVRRTLSELYRILESNRAEPSLFIEEGDYLSSGIGDLTGQEFGN